MADIKIRKRTTAKGETRYLALYQSPDGRWLSAGTWSSKKLATSAAMKAQVKSEESDWVDPRSGKILFKDFVETVWLKGRVGVVETNTLASNRAFLRNHLLPTFGEMPLNKILPSTVQTWVARMGKSSNLAPSSIESAHVLLASILKVAVKDGNLGLNHATGTKLPTITTPKVVVITPEQYTDFLRSLREDRRLMAEVSIETGMRWGEVIALCPAQIDFLRRTITIDRTIVETSRANTGSDSPYERKPYTKGGTPRVVRVGQDVIDGLAAVMVVREMDSRSTQEFFVSRRGTFLSRRDNSTYVRAAMKAAGIPDNVSWKHLRSSHCSWSLAGGADLAGVQTRMGHRQATTTQKYISVLPDADEKTLAAFDSIRNRKAKDQAERGDQTG